MCLFVTLIMVTVICAKACPHACDCNDFLRGPLQDDSTYTSVTCRSATNVTNEIPTSINKLSFHNLSYIDTKIVLTHNSLNHEKFPKLSHVSFLYCNVLNLSYANLNGLSKLKLLDLSRSKVTHLEEPFNITNLEALDLSSNRIRVIADNVFHNLSSLRTLNLSGNLVELLNQTIFTGMSKLESLDLAGNRLSIFKSEYFISLSTLQYLNLSNNLLQVLNEACCDSLQRLRHLDVSQNRLARVAPGSLQLPSLSHLVLAENPALGRSRSPSLLIGLGKRLQNVDISNTGLINIPPAITHSIKILRLSRNFIRYIGCGHLDSYPLLKLLDFSSNDLEVIEDDALGRLDLLSELYLSDNKLHSLPRHLPESLKKLFLQHNQIESLSRGDFRGMPLLQTLTLCDNKIKEIEEGAFTELENLSTLDLSRNPINVLPAGALEGPRQLRILRLANLSVTSPAKEMTFPLHTTEHLVTLDLSNSSGLTTQFVADTAALAASRELQELHLSGEQLKHISSDLPNFLPQLRFLYISNNPINFTGIQWNQLRNNTKQRHEYTSQLHYQNRSNEMKIGERFTNDNFNNFTEVNVIQTESATARINKPSKRRANDIPIGKSNLKMKKRQEEGSVIFKNETVNAEKVIMYSVTKGHPGILVLVMIILSATTIFVVVIFKSRKYVKRYRRRRNDNEVRNIPNVTELW
ncbi:chaoptin-like [Photinus pyralis]|uniref:chaoptin-like n=1 Tax=Photinus pyralis TaxID=7054 RepID=UPI00126741ED|nr:chaoptin-like [Photinus pyralis]